jgi:hypothetical protein
MPGCGIHLLLATRVLEAWGRGLGEAPFPANDPGARNAFLDGANAPDMGYYPGGYRLLTDFAHYLRSADLAREMVARATSPAEQGFAWGWVAHVLGDAWIHPLVNLAAGELLTGVRQPKTYADDPVAHVRVEMGADSWFHVRYGPASPRVRATFDARSVGFLVEAYAAVYGVRFDAAKVLASHRAVAGYVPWLLALDRVRGGRGPGLRTKLFAWSVYWPLRLFSRTGMAYALTHTVPPAAWFDAAIEGVVGSFAARYQDHVANRLATLPLYNLDTGTVESETQTYPLAVKAAADLGSLRRG